jgi:NADPH-dependent curcumin reductase CurA
MKPANTQCRLAARPTGLPKTTDFVFADEPVPTAADGEFVVEIDCLSVDPAMRRPQRQSARNCFEQVVQHHARPLAPLLVRQHLLPQSPS